MKNIYTRIGECLESNGVIDSVLAYDANEEEVLTQAGFVRCGSANIDDEIVDVYKKSKESRRVFKIVLDDMSNSDEIKYIERLKDYIHTKCVKSTKEYVPLTILDDYFFPESDITYDGHSKIYSDKPYLQTWNTKF